MQSWRKSVRVGDGHFCEAFGVVMHLWLLFFFLFFFMSERASGFSQGVVSCGCCIDGVRMDAWYGMVWFGLF